MTPISLTNPWVLFGALSAAIVIAGGGYYTGRVHGADKCEADAASGFRQQVEDLAINVRTAAGEVVGIRKDVDTKTQVVTARANEGVKDARELTLAGDKSNVSPILACVLIRQRGLEDPRCALPDSISGKAE